MGNFILINNADNVATATCDIKCGDSAVICDSDGTVCSSLFANADIVRGHKIAIRDIMQGERVIKYGFPIGIASQKICRGDYVHVHNLESERGRGDL